MPARFEALVFDLGGVIASHDNDLLYRRIATRCATPDALERLRGWSGDRDLGTGRLTVGGLHRRLCTEYGLAADWPEFARIWCSHLALDPPMLDYVERLARQRRVLIFSNTNAEHWDHLVALSEGRLGRFEAYLSHEIGQVKPDRAAFLDVAARAGIEPSSSLFIDDLAANIEGAGAAGFQTLLFTGRAALEACLSAR